MLHTYVAINNIRNVFNLCYTAPHALTVNITKKTESLSVVVQWDEVNDSIHTTYIVTWTSERDLNDIQIHTLIEQSSYTITGLTLDTVYTITVTASNRCGQGPEYRTSVSLTTDATSITSSLLISAGANPMTTMFTAASSSTSTATAIMIANSGTATTSSSGTYITEHGPAPTTVVMNPGATTTNPMATAVSEITSTTNSFIETAAILKTTMGNTNRIASATTIVMSSTSTANPDDTTTADTTTADESSKFSDIKHIQLK